MELTGTKNQAIVTLNVLTYTLYVDVGNKVLTVHYSGNTMLSSMLQDVTTIVEQHGYKLKQIKHVKIKPYRL